MNAASQFLRVLAILGAIGAGVLFWLTNGKTEVLKGQLGQAKTAASTTQSDLEKKIQDLTDQVAAAAKEKEDLQRQHHDDLNSVDAADKRFEAAKEALDATDTVIKEKDNKISALNAQVTDLSEKAKSIDDLSNRIVGLETEKAAIQKRLDDLMAEQSTQPIKGASGSSSSRTVRSVEPAVPVAPPQLSEASPAKVLQVDTKNWLLVLDVGTDNGVQKDAQLYIKVGDQPLGVVVVRDSQAKMATCAIASTDSMSPNDFAKIVTQGLKVDYQRAL